MRIADHVIKARLSQIVLGLTAAGELPDGEVPYTSVLCLEGVETDDGRLLQAGSIDWRTLPLSLMGLIETGWGHDGAILCGRIENIERDGQNIVGSGVFDSGEFGREIARLVHARFLNGVSIDLAVAEAEIQIPGQPDATDEQIEDAWWNGEPLLYVVVKGTILGATVCPFPAFADATIEVVEGEADDEEQAAVAASLGLPLEAAKNLGTRWRVTGDGCFNIGPRRRLAPTVAAAGIVSDDDPPAWWFLDPALSEPTPLTILDDGRVFGHVATWDACHEGYQDRCVRPPRCSALGMGFMLGGLRVDDGTELAVGTITMRTSHPDLHMGADDTRRHYDHTGTAVADVVYGEDEIGPWVAGALRRTLTTDDVRELRAAKLSGDWRPDGQGGLKLVGLLAVNVPGFPVPRPRVLAVAASAEARFMRPQAVVAANIVGTTDKHCGCGGQHRCACEAPSEADLELQRARVKRLARVAREGRPAVIASLAASARGE